MNATLTNPARASELVASLFAPSIVAYELREAADPRALLPEEAGTCDAFRPKRLAEFAAGRLCARKALAELGCPNFPLRRKTDRTAQWPDAVVGSLTHTVGFCAAVASLRIGFAGLGVDAEIIARVTKELWNHAFTPRELSRFAPLEFAERQRLAAVVFSAKEAFYKSQFSVTKNWLDYRDVSVELSPEDDACGTFLVKPATAAARWIPDGLAAKGRYRLDAGLVVTGIALSIEQGRQLEAAVPESV